MKEDDYWVLAYYEFVEIENPKLEVQKHKEFFKDRDATGRIYISEEGINGQMSAAAEDAKAYIEMMHSDPRFADMQVKIHYLPQNAFPRMTVKYRKQLVALDQKVDMSKGGEHVAPEKWREMLESDEDYLVLDVRNQYECAIGHFKGATLPPLQSFREFVDYAKQLAKEEGTDKPVMMYCTGGIRCEPYSALMKEEGFENVYQLDGGIINYGLKEGNKHWDGKLFVFDDRLAVPISDDKHECIAKCHHCGTTEDQYYNCANADCNELFICCSDCLEKHSACCSDSCSTSPRLRPLKYREGNKPFRRLSSYR